MNNSATRPLALVTGASSGIGVDFARELARRGYDLALAARRGDLLEEVKRQVRAEHDVDVNVFVGDLGKPGGAEQLFEQTRAAGRPVDFLVNNAGAGQFGPFLEQSLDEVLGVIQLNVAALTTLTRLFAKDMRGRGGVILNNASFSAFQPPTEYAVYGATKAYVLNFSQSLRADLRKSKVKISVLCPGFFTSDLLAKGGHKKTRLLPWVTMRSEHVARAGVAGALRGRAIIVPGLIYKLNTLLLRFLPRTTATALADIMVRN